MEFVDNFTVVSLISKILTISIEFFGLLEQSFFESILDWFMNINVIDTNASLSTIKKLSKENSHNSTVDFGCFVNNNWTLSTQLQNTGSQVVGSFFGNQSSCGGWSCKADQIKRQLSNGLGNFNFSFNDPVKP